MKNINKKLTAAFLVATSLLTACSDLSPSKIEEINIPLKNDENTTTALSYEDIGNVDYSEQMYSRGYNDFSFNLMANVINSEANNTNIMVSPASVMFALDLCAAGANGNTLDEINNLFAPNSNPMEQQAFASNFMDRINSSEEADISIANAIWGNSDRLGNGVNMDYLNYVDETFGATYEAQPFTMSTVNEINSWVDEHTNHMIDHVLDSLSEEATMVLVNAISFESEWLSQYEDYDISSYLFNNASGGTTTVDMLTSEENVYFETELATGFLKYYIDGNYAFVVMLPKDESISANEFLANFSGSDYQEFIDSISYENVIAKMPEFTYDYDSSLVEILQNMGVEEAFTENADFTGICSEGLFISDVIHKTHIDVNRDGTSAAAVTAVILDTCEIMEIEAREVILDRPYAYAIVDVNNGYLPIFVGTVNDL